MSATNNNPLNPDTKRRKLDELLGRLGGKLALGSDLERPVRERRSKGGDPLEKIVEDSMAKPFIDNPEKLSSLNCEEAVPRRGFENLGKPEGPRPPRWNRRPVRNLADFYPEARFLPPSSSSSETPDWSLGAWLLRTELPLDGRPASSGAVMPGGAGSLDEIDLSLASAFQAGLSFRGIEPSRLAVLDVESTGLMGSAVPFLVGLGFFEGDCFVVEQYFMEDLPGEAPMLEALDARLRDFQGLLSFNGRAFDVPLLQARHVLNRMPGPFGMPHLDLLHPARRLWRGHFESCGLAFLEKKLLGVARISDVPGSLIPRIYLEYIKGIRREQIVPVIDHNVQDVASTAALLPLFCRCYRDPENVELRNRFSQFGLATWYRRMNRPDESIRRLERAVLYCRDAAEEHALSMHAANALKREGRWRDAVDIWAERVKLLSDPAMRAEPCVELAKYYEHQVKDFGKALEWVRVALEPWRESRDLGRLLDAARQTDLLADMTDQDPGPAEGALAALVHRFKRLERRLEK